MKLTRILSGSILCLAVAAAAAPAAAFSVTDVQAHAEPSSYTGPCPAAIHFVGQITSDGIGTVTYRWGHSPGTGTIEAVIFDGPGTKTVTHDVSWSASDFLELNTVSPNEKIAPVVGVDIHCTLPGTQKTDLTITGFAFKSKGECAAGKTAFTLTATVKNAGTVVYPYQGQTARIIARDTSATYWFGTGSLPAIPAGGTVVVDIPVGYPTKPEDFMSAQPFQAQVDDKNVVDELNENNNLSAGTVSVNLKEICAKIPPLYKKKVPVKKLQPVHVPGPVPPDPNPIKQQVR
jgi:hypothetical protein